MATSISGSLSASPSLASSTPSVPATPQPAQKAAAPADTVKLSQGAQVLLLKQQGQSLTEIAQNLSLPMTIVDGYLGIPVSASTQQAAPVQSTPVNSSAAQ